MIKAIVISVSMMATGCATPYQPSSITGGFSELKLSENSYLVEFKGNAYTRASSARDFAVLRGAELCLSSGYAQFTITGVQDLTRTEAHVTDAGTSRTYGNVDNFGNVKATTYHYGPTTTTYTKPGTGIAIECLNNSDGALDAEMIMRALREKHGIK